MDKWVIRSNQVLTGIETDSTEKQGKRNSTKNSRISLEHSYNIVAETVPVAAPGCSSWNSMPNNNDQKECDSGSDTSDSESRCSECSETSEVPQQPPQK
ncbi:hypothetical protein JTB14_018891 [Gonioctena quinquepunctata]|nr:hypothetical protein JTB14_018891 [Gonioctena quinquepunctata]